MLQYQRAPPSALSRRPPTRRRLRGAVMENTDKTTTTPPAAHASTRRQFLVRAGLVGAGGAVATTLGSALLPEQALAKEAPSGCPMHGAGQQPVPSSATFGRMFPDLPPFGSNTA